MNFLTQYSKHAAALAAVLVAASGIAVCAAWLAGVPGSTRLLSASSTVHFNTGLLLGLCGISLLAAVWRRPWLAAGLAALVVVLGALTAVPYIAKVELAVDRLFVEPPDDPAIAAHMAPNTALTFVFAGLALLLLAAPSRMRWANGAAQMLGALVLALGGIALFGYAADLQAAFQWAGATRMAVLTAAALTLLGPGLILAAAHLAGARAWYELEWTPSTAGIGLAALATLGWYALRHAPPALQVADIVLALGLLAAILLSGAIVQARRLRMRTIELMRANATLEAAAAEVRDSESRLQQLLDGLQAAVVVHGPDTSIRYVNSAAVAILGLTRDQLLGKTTIDPYWHFVHEDGTPMTVAEYPVSLVFGSRAPLRDYVVGVRDLPTAPTRWVLVNAVPFVAAGGKVQQVVVSFMDISERTHQTQRLEKMVLTDALTGLATRRHLTGAAEREIAVARRAGNELSLLVFDVDSFKSINDCHGHTAGDAVLVQLAATVRTVLRQSDMAGRLGGEEFAVLLPQTDARGAREIAERLRAAIAASPCRMADGKVVPFTVSVGVATLEPADESLAALMDRADQGMYQAKRQGRNRVGVLADRIPGFPP